MRRGDQEHVRLVDRLLGCDDADWSDEHLAAVQLPAIQLGEPLIEVPPRKLVRLDVERTHAAHLL